MAIKVNLLPTELVLSGGINKVLRLTRMLGVISLAGFLIFGLGLAAFFIISTFQLNSLNSGNAGLKTRITGLESSEQKMILLKDRIAKIKTVQGFPTISKNLDNIEPVLGTLATGTAVNELDIDPTKVATTINFKSTGDMASFIKSLSSQTAFPSVILSSFGFNPASGYLVTVSFLSK